MHHIYLLEQFAKRKAADLEGTHGSWNIDNEKEPGAKRPKTDKEVSWC